MYLYVSPSKEIHIQLGICWFLLLFDMYLQGCLEKCPMEKCPMEKCPPEISPPGKLPPAKLPPGKLPPGVLPPPPPTKKSIL